ncbi:RNA-directed DNA polymerase, eukaryota, reverse transcriptase zinc-binding domain protein [Tanacetum coccineum]
MSWISWKKVCSPICCGGLGIGSLQASNIAMLSKWWWRFYTENNSFWRLIITSIHGRDGGLGENIQLSKHIPGPWKTIISLNRDLSKLNIDMSSVFVKQVGDGSSTRFWLDVWLGNSALKEAFPRLPTRYNLDIRGIDLDSTLCPVCNEAVETDQHLFLDCDIAQHLWKLIIKWWGLKDYPKDILGIVTWADSVSLPTKVKFIFDAVVLITNWSIWCYRNRRIFDLNPPRKDTLEANIKTLSFSWITYRNVKFNLDWNVWIYDPILACVATAEGKEEDRYKATMMDLGHVREDITRSLNNPSNNYFKVDVKRGAKSVKSGKLSRLYIFSSLGFED